MDEELINRRMTVIRDLRLKRYLQDAFRRGGLKKGALRDFLNGEYLAAMNMPSPTVYLEKMIGFTPQEALFLCAKADTPSEGAS